MAEHHPLRTRDQDPRTSSYARHNAEAERRAKECRSARMPDLQHLGLRDYAHVYEPSDDTYLLLDALGADVDAREAAAEGDGDETCRVRTTLEIGCGTGVPSVYLALRLRGMAGGHNDDDQPSSCNEEQETKSEEKNRRPTEDERDAFTCEMENKLAEFLNDPRTTAAHMRKMDSGLKKMFDQIAAMPAEDLPAIHYVTDINPEAIRIAKATAEKNGISSGDFRACQCDLAADLLPRLENAVDVLIFNPPYVPTPDEEVGSDGIAASWAGGRNGRVVLDRALPQIARLLAYPRGVAYVVVVDDNYPEEVCRTMAEAYGVTAIPWLRRRARNEFLTILKMVPTRRFRSEGQN